jgi:hypothetical protein
MFIRFVLEKFALLVQERPQRRVEQAMLSGDNLIIDQDGL